MVEPRITPQPADGFAGHLTVTDAWELLRTDPEAVIVDVRTEGEWRTIGVPDVAQLGKTVGFAQWVTPQGPNPAFVDEVLATGVRPGQPIVFLCRSGQRSIGASAALTAAGYGPAYNVLHGFEGDVGPDGRRGHTGWQAAGLPTTTWPSDAATGATPDEARA
ncbi:rhodanese-related sulfurtransferase [Sediminihabitans luteus]|uniref:Rhodanese-related sulfurtransferase n=1 Tax=Sediminihabitans luteus TaxID=1138585 RepID=A0A2M9D0C0_9CELL|nr:rhodanese-like domain-containing protein [Sediminihabitans luteus]PJJ77631.1 rhodanese-related sulfurtransferase [Sediminihabitans luteus]GII98531.1 hypothetical protein Slu03_09090 [Sediminihabitans luteus]